MPKLNPDLGASQSNGSDRDIGTDLSPADTGSIAKASVLRHKVSVREVSVNALRGQQKACLPPKYWELLEYPA